MRTGRTRMQDYPEFAIDMAKGVPPATVAVLTVFGVSISDAVQAVMFIWALTLVVQKAWQFVRWLRRRGWTER